jgi:hypothetical protein
MQLTLSEIEKTAADGLVTLSGMRQLIAEVKRSSARVAELERALRDLLNDYEQEHRQLTDGEYEFKSPAISRARSALGLKPKS